MSLRRLTMTIVRGRSFVHPSNSYSQDGGDNSTDGCITSLSGLYILSRHTKTMQSILTFTLFVCLFMQVQSLITGDATCFHVMQFFVDGILTINDDKWSTSSPVKIPDSTKVIGIGCINFIGYGGIKVALSNGVKTDTTWKCSNKWYREWYMPGFDDSAWSNAVKVPNKWGTTPSSLNGKADWIWTSGLDGFVYCRKDMEKPFQSIIIGEAICDDVMYFYADGVQKIKADFPNTSPVFIPESTQVIGIRCVNKLGRCGIKVALSNGVKTDTTWKCSNKFEKNWNRPGFDDSAWNNAVKPKNDYTPASLMLKTVDWIWTSGWEMKDKDVYCRKVIKKAGF